MLCSMITRYNHDYAVLKIVRVKQQQQQILTVPTSNMSNGYCEDIVMMRKADNNE